jgi:hypothetical protein
MIKAPHFSIMLALALVACAGNGPPPPANFAIQAHTRSVNATTFKVLVSGIAFSPGGQVAITYTNVPNRPGVQNGSLQATVEPDGTFNYVEDSTARLMIRETLALCWSPHTISPLGTSR